MKSRCIGRRFELEETRELDEVALKAVKEKMEAVQAWMAMEKSKIVAEAKSQAVEQFKAFANFEAEVIKGSIVAYGFRFEAYKAQVA